MKILISINQREVVQSGLHTQTNLVDWGIVSYLRDLWDDPHARRITPDSGDGPTMFVQFRARDFLEEMPLLRIHTKSTVTARIKKLKSLNLIEVQHDWSRNVYLKPTDLLTKLWGNNEKQ
jgi:hypothetical protein